MWLRALILCDDVRFEIGGAVTLVGVYGERLLVSPGTGPILLARLAFYTCVAGLKDIPELSWRQTLVAEDSDPGTPTSHGRELHDVSSDEHRLISVLSPVEFPEPGRYRLALELETRRERKSFDYYFSVERLPAQTS